MSPSEILAAAVALRRDIHRHPELSHLEFATQARLEAAVRTLGLTPVRVAGTGLYADVCGTPGPKVCIRADTDALPLHEDPGLPYASEVPGVMHACGHDVHAAAAWAAMAHLCADPPAGTVRVLFQPAEERGDGARACIEAGALEGFDAVVGGHVDLDYPVGRVGIQAGPICAGTDHFRVTVQGHGGHGARPHAGADALCGAAALVVALQQIVAREIEPGRPAVVTVGTFRAGERYNILAARAVLEGTLRSHDPAVRAHLREAVARVARGVTAAASLRFELELFPGNEPVVNDRALTRAVKVALDRLLGPGATVPLARLNTGGEDFSELHRDRPGVYLRWGASGPGASSAPAHSSGFRVDEGVLGVAGSGLATAARAMLGHLLAAQ
jgi:amidohydrolase